MRNLFTFTNYVPDPSSPGKGTYTKCKLSRSLFPYKSGTTFDEITIDVSNGTIKFVRGSKTTSYSLITQLSVKKD